MRGARHALGEPVRETIGSVSTRVGGGREGTTTDYGGCWEQFMETSSCGDGPSASVDDDNRALFELRLYHPGICSVTDAVVGE